MKFFSWLQVSASTLGILGAISVISGTAEAQVSYNVTPFANNVTALNGMVKMGNFYWISDCVQGFCTLGDRI